MALLNGLYIFVEDEDVDREYEGTEHPVETGIDITDHIRPQAKVLNLKGEIVGKDAANTLSQIMALAEKGSLISYVGRNTFANCQIRSFKTGHPNTIWGGCSFDMTIKEVRIAQKAVVKDPKTGAKKKSGLQQTESGGKKKRYYTVKKGDCRWSIAEAYKSHGVTIESLTRDNNNSSCLNEVGNWYSLKVGAKVYLGEW